MYFTFLLYSTGNSVFSINSTYLKYTTYLPQKTAAFLRMRANLSPSFFTASTICLLCSRFHLFAHLSPPHRSPLYYSGQTERLCGVHTTYGLSFSTTQPLYICCASTWLTVSFQLLFLRQIIGQSPYVCYTSLHCP